MAERADSFADTDTLPAFAPKPRPARPVIAEQIERLAEINNFPSRQPAAAPSKRPARRRYCTGRDRQINIKATPETIERLNRLADALRLPFGAVLDKGLDARERELSSRPR